MATLSATLTMRAFLHGGRALFRVPGPGEIAWRSVLLCRNAVPLCVTWNRSFQSSQTRRAAPFLAPLLVKLASPLSRFVALLGGRYFRKWWKKLPSDTREKYAGILLKNRPLLVICSAGLVAASGGYYVSHVKETPVTGRRRFIILNDDQLNKVAEVQWKAINQEFSDKRLPVDHVDHMRVMRVARRILEANISKEVSSLTWEVNVIDDDTEVNAFVLGNGQMFVYTGILKIVSNDDELAGILGHEIAHAILKHPAEQFSRAGFVNVFVLAVIAALWAVVPFDGVGLIAHYLQNMVENIVIHLPYARKLEMEADQVGLLLAARACYDVRHVPEFWHRTRTLDETAIDWFSTHPSNESRLNWLTELMPEALQLRQEYNCSELQAFKQAANLLAPTK